MNTKNLNRSEPFLSAPLAGDPLLSIAERRFAEDELVNVVGVDD